jgi:flagellar biosynthesis anti-sigma factor FlgM
MTISIGGLGAQPKTELGDSTVDRVTSNAANKTSQDSDTGVSGETTTLLAGAASLAALTKVAMSSNDSRASKVEQLRAAVAAGTYKLAPGGIADALLAEWK